MLTADDKWAIGETIAKHGHLFDEGQLDRLDELFTEDVVYDISDLGDPPFFRPLHGIDAVRDAALELGPRNPLAHIVTNIVITEVVDDETVTVRSKAINIMADHTCGTATYVDVVRRQADGWRISHRRILARRTPLGGARADGCT
jgi:hypothetical protein